MGSHGTAKFRMLMGGRFLVQDYTRVEGEAGTAPTEKKGKYSPALAYFVFVFAFASALSFSCAFSSSSKIA